MERQRLGRYQLIRSLASGGMGEIFLAEHTGIAGFAKRVALKRIRPELANDPAYVQLFLNEARIGSFLNHPNIVHIFDVGHEGSALWLVMEYVDGIDLKRLKRRSFLAGQPLAPSAVAAIAAEVLSALDEAHHGGPCRRAPIIHRDISPENVLIARSGAVKVLDFGLAKWVPRQDAVPSMEGNMIFGKVRYMPPEQLRGQLIDVRADLFALGVVMYETIYGELPFGRGSADQVLSKVLEGPPPPATSRRTRPDPMVDAIIARALAVDPDERYQSANEMRLDIVHYLEASSATLPAERLRSMFLPENGGFALRNPEAAEELGHTTEDDPSPTEIALLVADRCGKCGGPFNTLFLDGMILDRCESCRGVWLDSGEVERLLGRSSSAPGKQSRESFERAPLDLIVGSCPLCRTGLRAFAVPEHPAYFEVCPVCHGVWLDRGELPLLQERPVASWLKRLVAATHPSHSQ